MKSNASPDPPSLNKKMPAYAGIFLIALAARGIPLLTAELGGDEAVIGIMSLRVLAGEFPVFFYGQNFMGSTGHYRYLALAGLIGGVLNEIRLTVSAVRALRQLEMPRK